MTLVLDDVSKKVGAEVHIRDVSLTLTRGSLNVLLGADAVGQDLPDAPHGRARRPTTGRVLVDGKDVTGRPVQQRSVAMVYQQFINYPSLTVYENIASPLRVRGGRATRSTGGQEARQSSCGSSPIWTARRSAVRRPAAAHRARARAGQGRRSGAARRAARQSRLQAARGAARRAAAHLRGVGRDLRLCDDRALRGAAARRQHRDPLRKARHAVRPTPRSIASPNDLRVAQVFSDPPLNIVGIEKERRADRATCRRHPRRRRLSPACPTAPIASASAPISSNRRHRRPPCVRSPRSPVTEITGSESFVHLNRDAAPGWRCCRACMNTSRARARCRARSRQSIRVRRRRPPGRGACSVARRHEGAPWPAFDLVDLAHSYGGNPRWRGLSR